MHLLEAVLQHRPVDLVEQLRVDSYLVGRRHPQEVAIERRMVNLAKCHTIWHHGIPALLGVTDDVSGVKEL